MKPFNKSKSFVFTCLVTLLGLFVANLPTIHVNAAGPVSVPRNVRFDEVVSGLDDPLFVTNAGDGSGRLFIVERGGQIQIFKNGLLNGTPFLDVNSLIITSGGEQGLLGLAFDPSYETNGRFFIAYTAVSTGAIKLARYSVSGGDPDLANSSGTVLLTINHPNHQNHNGGMLAFGPDGYLYMAVGDGGGGGDPNNNGQNKNALLGKILRLDVSGSLYSVPNTNPFFGGSNVKEEIWAYGLRNPWRFSFDKTTGDLYIGDVGQNMQEEIDFQTSASSGGENYGWNVLEGNLCYPDDPCTPPANYTPPVQTYDHGVNDSNGCSVTGGYVYRGSQFLALQGVYLFGDFCKGKVWGMFNNGSAWVSDLISDTDYLISSFGEGEDGEVYLVDYGVGKIYHIVEAPPLQATFLSDAAFDGSVLESSENSAQGGAKNPTSTIFKVGDNSADRQFRSILSFATDGLPDNAGISSLELKIKIQGFVGGNMFTPVKIFGNLLMDIRQPYFGLNANLTAVDFQSTASANSVGVLTSVTNTGWYTVVLKNTAFQHVNRTGATQFRLRFQKDDNDDMSDNYLKIFSGDAPVANRPQLTVVYFVP